MNRNTSITRRAFIWNTVSGMVNAGQSALILIFISHYLTHTDAGVFTIAFALANLFSTMGRYGVRNYQVTDVQENNRFAEYLRARVYTVAASLGAMLIYVGVQTLRGIYTPGKTGVIAIICLWKTIDAVEDVYYGMYQQKGRLDIGAKCYSLRLIASTVVFCVLLALHASLLTASVLSAVVSIAFASMLVRKTIPTFQLPRQAVRREAVGKILRVCLPLFIGTTLSIFVGNSPKYMID